MYHRLPSVSCGPVCGCKVSVYVHVLPVQVPRGPPRTSTNMSTNMRAHVCQRPRGPSWSCLSTPCSLPAVYMPACAFSASAGFLLETTKWKEPGKRRRSEEEPATFRVSPDKKNSADHVPATTARCCWRHAELTLPSEPQLSCTCCSRAVTSRSARCSLAVTSRCPRRDFAFSMLLLVACAGSCPALAPRPFRRESKSSSDHLGDVTFCAASMTTSWCHRRPL